MAGHFAFIGDHGMGHTVPSSGRARVAIPRDHSFGVKPEPCAAALPSYCAL